MRSQKHRNTSSSLSGVAAKPTPCLLLSEQVWALIHQWVTLAKSLPVIGSQFPKLFNSLISWRTLLCSESLGIRQAVKLVELQGDVVVTEALQPSLLGCATE